MIGSKAAVSLGARGMVEVRNMQVVAVLLAIFVLSFVAGIGWYTGRGGVRFVAGAVARGGTKPATTEVERSG
jgi:hypothetical protein